MYSLVYFSSNQSTLAFQKLTLKYLSEDTSISSSPAPPVPHLAGEVGRSMLAPWLAPWARASTFSLLSTIVYVVVPPFGGSSRGDRQTISAQENFARQLKLSDSREPLQISYLHFSLLYLYYLITLSPNGTRFHLRLNFRASQSAKCSVV